MRRKKTKRSFTPANALFQQRRAKTAGRKGLFSTRFYESIKDLDSPKVCIVRKVGGIGDVLMITPALRELKKRVPTMELTLGIDRHSTYGDIYYELLKNADFIDHLVDARYVDRKNYYNCVDISAVCIPYERKSLPTRNRINIFANHLGMQKLEDPTPFYKKVEKEEVWAKAYMEKHFRVGAGPIIALHTASNEDKRSWPVHQMLNFIKYMQYHVSSVQFLILDQNNTYADWGKMRNTVCLKSSTVREMAALIDETTLFVGPDSGPMHLAGALGKKSVVIFGSIPPEARINHYPNHVGVRMDELKCIGCWYSKCPYNFKCMEKLSGSRVGDAALKHLHGLSP